MGGFEPSRPKPPTRLEDLLLARIDFFGYSYGGAIIVKDISYGAIISDEALDRYCD